MRARRGAQPAAVRRSHAAWSTGRETMSGMVGERLRTTIPAKLRAGGEVRDAAAFFGGKDPPDAFEALGRLAQLGEPALVQVARRREPRRGVIALEGRAQG